MKRPIIILFFISFAWANNIFGQACPACSNPALQSSEKLEAGADTLQSGEFRVTLNVTNGYNYQGGHLNSTGLSPEGIIIGVPLHEHIVSLDFYRLETNLEYTFATNWTIWLRVPFDIKDQTAIVDFIEPVSNYERDAIIRNRDIHHRNSTYSGLSDFRFLISRRLNEFLGKKGRLDLAIGTSIPIGKTEGDPLEAGSLGIRHQHIQFGSGTFDPLFELHYTNSITRKLSFAAFSINKLPFYENRKTYVGPQETTTGIGFGYSLTNWLISRVTLSNFSQSRAKWNGVKDPNSGLISFNGTVYMTFHSKAGLLITPGFRFPIYQKTMIGNGDVFEYGSTFLLNVSKSFN